MKTNKIIHGDSLSVLKTLPEKSINMLLTSPPYWALRDYGTATWEGGDKNCNHQYGRNMRGGFTDFQKGNKGSVGDEAIKTGECCKLCGARRIDKQLGLEPTFDLYIKHLCDIFDEVKRVLRDDGTIWVNIGDTYSGGGGMTGITEDTPSYKTNPILKHNVDTAKNPDGNIMKIKNKLNPLQPKSLCNIPARFSIEMQNRGWILRNKIIWHKRNCMPSSVKDRFTVDFEEIFFFSKKKKYYFETQYEPLSEESKKDFEARKRRGKLGWGDGQTSKNAGTGLDADKIGRTRDEFYNEKGRNKRTVWTINPKPFKEAHFAIFPEELCETPIKAGCPIGGIVLDPFFGSGTTGLVALKQNKKFIGIELNKEYIEISKKRLKPFLEQEKL